jgi:hypothetical protein
MARQNISQKNRKSPATTTPLSAIGTKNSVTANGLLGAMQRIVPVKDTVTVQRLGAVAAGTALRFEGKSCCRNCSASRTKRIRALDMAAFAARERHSRRVFSDGAFAAELGCLGFMERGRRR